MRTARQAPVVGVQAGHVTRAVAARRRTSALLLVGARSVCWRERDHTAVIGGGESSSSHCGTPEAVRAARPKDIIGEEWKCMKNKRTEADDKLFFKTKKKTLINIIEIVAKQKKNSNVTWAHI